MIRLGVDHRESSRRRSELGHVAEYVAILGIPVPIANAQIDLLPVDHDERGGGTIRQVHRHEAIVDPSRDAGRRFVVQFDEPNDQLIVYHAHRAIRG